ncbi:isopentenyl-diphosphate Delta-isomerase [Flavobacteriaceae bacterium]|nr:isopentenyl-diphosphate Delta-isomerase [Flavobacteriaceae bacterium]
MNKEMVILVDKDDNELGLMEKLEVHQKGLLHRAFSVFLLNDSNQLLLQKRALDKYHSPGLWTNTCCSHQRKNEKTIDAADRRLFEEMGIKSELKLFTSFIYKAEFDNGLIEHEFDHVIVGSFVGNPVINQLEVCDWKWEDLDLIKENLKTYPDDYTEWFKIIFLKFYNKYNK